MSKKDIERQHSFNSDANRVLDYIIYKYNRERRLINVYNLIWDLDMSKNKCDAILLWLKNNNRIKISYFNRFYISEVRPIEQLLKPLVKKFDNRFISSKRRAILDLAEKRRSEKLAPQLS